MINLERIPGIGGDNRESVDDSLLLWDTVEQGKDRFVLHKDADEPGSLIDVSHIVGPEGFIGVDRARQTGQEYERDLIGSVENVPFVRLSSGVVVNMGQAYKQLEMAKKRGALLDKRMVMASAKALEQHFDTMEEEDREHERTPLLNDIEDECNAVMRAIGGRIGGGEVVVRSYPSSQSPLDSFGVDFFVDGIFNDHRRRVYCDLTQNTNKDIARGFAHIVIAHVSNSASDKNRHYMAQVRMIAQRIVHNIVKGTAGVDYDRVETTLQ